MAETNKKENLFARIARWFREMRSELKKVVWTGKSQLVKNTLTVIACSIVVGAFIWVFDLIATGLYNGILQLAELFLGK